MKSVSILAIASLCVLTLCPFALTQAKPSAADAGRAHGGDSVPPPATRPAAAKGLALDLGDSVMMKLVLIPAGKFTMGSGPAERLRAAEVHKRITHSDKPLAELAELFVDEGPQRDVKITKPFYIGLFEVTQAQWTAVMGTTVVQERDKAGPSWPLVGQGVNHPMYYVSWEEAVEFCRKLSQKTGKTVRLPTEAEWELACRAGTRTLFSFGDDYADLHKYGNYCDRSNTLGLPHQDTAHSDGHDKTASVGSFRPNDFGLYDTQGNVGEWCSDWYADSYSTAQTEDPTGPASGRSRILRGGSWSSYSGHCRSSYRSVIPPEGRIHSIVSGFRVVVAAEASSITPTSQSTDSDASAQLRPAECWLSGEARGVRNGKPPDKGHAFLWVKLIPIGETKSPGKNCELAKEDVALFTPQGKRLGAIAMLSHKPCDAPESNSWGVSWGFDVAVDQLKDLAHFKIKLKDGPRVDLAPVLRPFDLKPGNEVTVRWPGGEGKRITGFKDGRPFMRFEIIPSKTTDWFIMMTGPNGKNLRAKLGGSPLQGDFKFLWIDQPFEIRDSQGNVLYKPSHETNGDDVPHASGRILISGTPLSTEELVEPLGRVCAP